MRTLENRPSRYRDQLTALSMCALVALLLAFALLPRGASAHTIPQGGVSADCVAGTVSVSVTSWEGDVEIVNTDTKKVTDKPASGTATVVFTIDEIGGNGNYTAGRKDNPTDPVPVPFTVHCTPNLSVTKVAGAASVSAGSQIGYTITVHNDGPGKATAVSVNDSLPTGSGISWSIDPVVTGCSITGTAPQVLGCKFGDLASGASKSVHVVSGTTTASCAKYDNTATVSATNQENVTSGKATTTVQCATSSVLGTTAPAQAVQAAAVTAPNTGRGDIAQHMMVPLVLVLVGAAILLIDMRFKAIRRKI